jgi:hypothetical protein
MTLSNLFFVVFLDPYQGIYDVCLLSLTLHLIGLCGAYRWGDSKYILVNIYCTVKLEERVIQSNQDVHICRIYGM